MPNQPKTVIEKVMAKHVFSDVEKLDIGTKLSLVIQGANAIEDEKKRVNSDYKAKLDGAAADAALLSNNLTNGYDMRPTECQVEFNPKLAKKTYRSVETGQIVGTAEMTPHDFQLHFPDGWER